VAESVFAPGAAPSERELARAEAAIAEGGGLPQERLRPGPLRLPPVLERMEAMELFGPSTLEEYAECPYRWFVDHELRPRRIGPEDESLNVGSVAHQVLEKLYDEPPADRKPMPQNLSKWLRRAGELVDELGPKRLPRERTDTAAALRRVRGLLLAFLADEARASTPFEPGYAEASFGIEGSQKPPLPLAGGGVHGQIDRIDLGPGGALVQDYKSGANVEGGAGMLENKGKLQLQLYMLAARELWELELAGGLYRPLGGRGDRQPKGLLRKSAGDDLASLDPRPNDHLSDEAFEGVLAEARARAEQIIADIHRGEIARRPIHNRCPDYCGFQPICRRERGLPEEEPRSGEEDEE
jgi:RecB family exonuclease